MKKHHKLQNTVLVGFLLLTLILVLVISFVVGIQYYQKEMNNSSNTAFTYTKAAAEYIDGDKIEGYLETGQKDEYYYEILDFFNAYQAHSDIRYYYLFVPEEDYLIYIWDADNEEGACELGYKEEYMEGGKEVLQTIFKKNPAEKISIVNDDTYGYIASAYSPVFNSAGEPVAVVGVDMLMPDLQKNITKFLIRVVMAIVLIVLASVFVFFFIVKMQVVNPIKKLSDASKSMVENLETQDSIEVDIKTGNEIEELSDSFKEMFFEVKDYIAQLSRVTAEKERIGAELSIATQIQSSMLPCIFPAFPDREEIDIYATMTPAKEVGGDFYDFFMVDDSHLAIVMADVSGKGVPAALFMVIGKTLIKDHTLPGRDLGEVFTEVNNILCESNDNGLFITAFEGVLDLVTGEFRYVNAGHEMPFIYRKEGGYEAYKIRPGFVLAGMENIKYKENKIQLNIGDKVFQYTDGVTEATDKDNRLFGIERLANVLNEKCLDSNPQQTLEMVKENIDIFVGDNDQFDDITMLCLEYTKKMEGEPMREITVDAIVENIGTVTDFVEEILDSFECPMKVKMQVDIAIDELFGNICHYAYGDTIGKATVKVEKQDDPKAVCITFIDSGIPYNPLEKDDPDITLSSEEREIGGLGIFMVKKNMDEVYYNYCDGQNQLTVKKHYE